MDLFDLFITVFQSIRSHKLRTFLTTLGILIGISSVILLMAIGHGIENYLVGQFNKLGSNLVYILPGNIKSKSGKISFSSERNMFFAKPLKERYETLLAKADHVEGISVISKTKVTAKYRQKEYDVELSGVRARYFEMRKVNFVFGQGFNKAQAAAAAKKAVLGFNVYKELFDQGVNPVGKTIFIGPSKFKVVGVLEEMGSNMGGVNYDDFLYIPHSTMKKIDPSAKILVIVVKLDSMDDFDGFKKQADAILTKAGLTKDDFSVVSQKELVSSITDILAILSLGLSGIAAISLLVGGIGIMNIMLVSVTERVREIGLRKALGATSKDILMQFLFESSILGLIGGFLGLGLGYAGSLLLVKFIPSSIQLGEVVLAIGVSFLTGVVFGSLPARKAAKLNPIDALRYE